MMAKLPTLLCFSLLVFKPMSNSIGASGIKTSPVTHKRKAEVDLIKNYENEVMINVVGRLPFRQFAKDSPIGSWHEVKPTFDRPSPHFLLASVNYYKGKPVRVTIDHWEKNTNIPDETISLFHPDGTLAKYILVLQRWPTRTAHGTAGQIQYFDDRGHMLLSTIASKNWKTGKFTPLKNLPSTLLAVYMRIDRLPFYGLLEKASDLSRS